MCQHADDRLGGERRGKIAEDAGRDAGCEVRLDVGDEGLMDLAEELVELRAVPEKDLEDVAVLGSEAEKSLPSDPGTPARIDVRGLGGVHRLPGSERGLANEVGEERVFGGEVQIEGAGADVGGGGDVGDLRSMEAVGREEALGSGEEPAAGLRPTSVLTVRVLELRSRRYTSGHELRELGFRTESWFRNRRVSL